MIYASRFLRYEDNPINGPDVYLLQERLSAKGHTVILNGIYDIATQNAVKSIQHTLGIKADGVVGPAIWNILNINEVFPHNKGLQSSLPSILVDLNKRRLTFTINGKSTTYPVAIGKRSTPTPLGNWVIVQKAINPGGPFGARWMRLSVPWGGYGIHGTNNPASIGKAVSHGCIRMYNKDVIYIYDLTPIGTPVNIIGNLYTKILKKGDKGNNVKQLQRDLKKLGYYKFSIDGYFGPKTYAAVVKFQIDQNLISDGIVGPYTSLALQKELDIINHEYQP